MTKKYTSEENRELIEDIRNPFRHYRITLWGYGGESAYIELTKEAHDYWKEVIDDAGDSDLVGYLVDAQDEESDVMPPPEADFLAWTNDDNQVYHSSWYEAPTEVCHQYGVTYSEARITIEEVDSDQYNAETVDTLVDGEELDSWVNQLQEEWDYEFEMVEMDVVEEAEPNYVLQMYSSEKGTFFEGYFTTAGRFDPKKLRIYTTEYWNGDDTVENITYEGHDVENAGGDTNGKGYYAHVWSNVNE